jgi:hypothetical protein
MSLQSHQLIFGSVFDFIYQAQNTQSAGYAIGL